mmetsp:Transcript_50139/g.160439  ORF Transcript_50139/g.160439 Transcript_50139/m.160439 type:complete len:414 (+) Transcript_50139:390-1631(+)
MLGLVSIAGTCAGPAPKTKVVFSAMIWPVFSSRTRSTATSEDSSRAAASRLPCACMRSASASACALIREASASDCAEISLALALPRAAISACCAPAAATAPALSAASKFGSLGTAEMTLMETMLTPYWEQISLACFAARDICWKLKIWETPQASLCPGSEGIADRTAGVAASTMGSTTVTLLLAETWASSAYRILPIAAAREAVACLSTSRRSTEASPTPAVLTVSLRNDCLLISAASPESMVAEAMRAASAGSSTRQQTVAYVSSTTLSAVVARKEAMSSVWIFREISFSNFQFRWVSMWVEPPCRMRCRPLSWVMAAYPSSTVSSVKGPMRMTSSLKSMSSDSFKVALCHWCIPGESRMGWPRSKASPTKPCGTVTIVRFPCSIFCVCKDTSLPESTKSRLTRCTPGPKKK